MLLFNFVVTYKIFIWAYIVGKNNVIAFAK